MFLSDGIGHSELSLGATSPAGLTRVGAHGGALDGSPVQGTGRRDYRPIGFSRGYAVHPMDGPEGAWQGVPSDEAAPVDMRARPRPVSKRARYKQRMMNGEVGASEPGAARSAAPHSEKLSDPSLIPPSLRDSYRAQISLPQFHRDGADDNSISPAPAVLPPRRVKPVYKRAASTPEQNIALAAPYSSTIKSQKLADARVNCDADEYEEPLTLDPNEERPAKGGSKVEQVPTLGTISRNRPALPPPAHLKSGTNGERPPLITFDDRSAEPSSIAVHRNSDSNRERPPLMSRQGSCSDSSEAEELSDFRSPNKKSSIKKHGRVLKMLKFLAMVSTPIKRDKPGKDSATISGLKRFDEVEDVKWYIFRESSKRRFWWDFLILLCVLYNVWRGPFELTFKWEDVKDGVIRMDNDAINLTTDLLLIADVVVWSFTTFQISVGVEETRPRKVFVHYLTSWFPIDAVSSLPWDLITGHWAGRIGRWLRLVRVIRYFKVWERSGIVHRSHLRLGQSFLLVLLILHWIACLFALIQNNEASVTDDWVYMISWNELEDSTADTSHCWPGGLCPSVSHFRYFLSLYVSLGMITGYASFNPHTMVEVVFTFFVNFFGLFLYIMVFSNIVALISAMNASETAYRERLALAIREMNRKNLNEKTQARVRNYLRLFYDEFGQGQQEKSVLSDLPSYMRRAVNEQLFEQLLSRVPIFAGVESKNRGFSDRLLQMLRQDVVMKGEYLMITGEMGFDMFFLISGTVGLSFEVGGEITKELGAGSVLGEIALITEGQPRTMCVRALTSCTLFVLSKDDFDRVISNYPALRESMRQTAKARLSKLKRKEAESQFSGDGCS